MFHLDDHEKIKLHQTSKNPIPKSHDSYFQVFPPFFKSRLLWKTPGKKEKKALDTKKLIEVVFHFLENFLQFHPDLL